MLGILGEEGHHALAEILRNDDGGIVFAGFRAIDGLLFGGEGPVELAVGAQGVDHLIAHVDLDGNQIAFVAGVDVRDGEFEIAGIGERIPAGGHVEPSEQRGQHGQADDDDYGHDVAGEAFDVAYEQLPDCLHALSFSFFVRWCLAALRVSLALRSSRARFLRRMRAFWRYMSMPWMASSLKEPSST